VNFQVHVGSGLQELLEVPSALPKVPVFGDAHDDCHFLAVPGHELWPVGLYRSDEFAEALLGFLKLPAAMHEALPRFYLDSLDKVCERLNSSSGRTGGMAVDRRRSL
jgi:hypothetical protein